MTPLDPQRWPQARALFDACADLPLPERLARLDAACPDDPELRAEVLELLQADAQADAAAAILAGSVASYASLIPAEDEPDPGPEIGRVIGAYRIAGRLGEGSMGIVYEAEQENPRRRVALKAIRGGPFLDEVRLRLFRREAEALARLRHPGIAAIYEAGITEDGQHWIAMELVRGVPLDHGWDRAPGAPAPERGEIARRLELILQVCDVVGYAHQRGVLHRDLKPSNILRVDEEGAAGRPIRSGGERSGRVRAEPAAAGRGIGIKILDFGLARITSDDPDTSVAPTEAVALQGTLPYMSPEQARGVAEEIDTRSDLYAIGVLLYQAVTGVLPRDLERMSLPRALRTICEESPPPPRGRNPAVSADLDAIIQKALALDPARRYASVPELAADLVRLRSGHPVLARPPSAVDQLRKLAARHRTAVLLGAGLLLAVMLGAAGTTVGMVRARQAAAAARAEAETAEQVSRFLEELFTVSDPGEARGNSITARELLDEGAARIESSLRDQPAVQARLLATIGEVYRKLGLYREARGPMERSLELRRADLGDRHPDVARGEYALAGLLRRLGEYEAARGCYERALAAREEALGPDHPDVAASLSGLANLMLERGEYAAARPRYERAIAILERTGGPDDPRLPSHLFNYALLLQRTGELAPALEVYQRILALHEATLGPDHPEVAADLTSLGHAFRAIGDSTRSRLSFERALRIQERVLGPDHTDLGETWAGLASLHLAREDWWPARRALLPACRIMTRALGASHPTTAMLQTNQSLALRMTGEVEAAIAMGEEALSTLEASLGPDHPYVATSVDRLAGHYAAAGRLARARALFERAVSIRRSSEGVEPYLLAESLWGLAEMQERLEGHAASAPTYAEAGRVRLGSGPEADPLWLRRFAERVARLRALGDGEGAEALERAVETWHRGRGTNPGDAPSGADPGEGDTRSS